MSKCISPHGEYSEHEGNGEFCEWCGDCNHEAIRHNAAAQALRDAAKDITKGYDPETDMRIFDAWDVSEILTAFAKQIEGNVG